MDPVTQMIEKGLRLIRDSYADLSLMADAQADLTALWAAQPSLSFS
jgi:hypothetical protein